MSYKNGKDILPPNLLKQLQNYIQGEIIYVPRKSRNAQAGARITGRAF